jgi:hypothetical protein
MKQAMAGKAYFYRIGRSDKARTWSRLPMSIFGWPEWAKAAYLRGFNGYYE